MRGLIYFFGYYLGFQQLLFLEYKMQNNYQAMRTDFIYIQNPLIYFSNGEIMFTNTFIQNEVLANPKINYETAFFQLQQKYQQLRLENEELKKQLQAMSNHEQSTPTPKRTLIRRKQDELDKKHGCCYQNCKKYYASELALNLHIKTKHKGGTKKQRDDLAKQIILAQMQGKVPPKPLFRLPQGYVEQYKAQHNLQKKKNISNLISDDRLVIVYILTYIQSEAQQSYDLNSIKQKWQRKSIEIDFKLKMLVFSFRLYILYGHHLIIQKKFIRSHPTKIKIRQ